MSATEETSLQVPVAIAGVSHHTATADVLERMRFPDEKAFLEEARERFRGIVLLQTCNRVECGPVYTRHTFG